MEIVRTPVAPERSVPLLPTELLPTEHLQDRPTVASVSSLVPARRRILVFDYEDEGTMSIVSECLAGDDYELVYCRTLTELTEYLLSAHLTGHLPGATPFVTTSIAGSTGPARGENSGDNFDLLLWGLKAPFEEGLKTLRDLRELATELRVVLLAPQEALAFAPAIKLANVDSFVLKPLHLQDIKVGVERALRRPRSEARESREGKASAVVTSAAVSSSDSVPQFEDGRDLGLIGTSAEMRKTISLVRRVGPSNVNVLITGESGSGKEMVANAIHRVSDRARKPFIAINCAAIPRELLESELFGHAKGAFTGATAARRGLFEEAHEGTILLDEIGDLPLPLQAKILRLLQTKQVKPLGQNTVREVDVRIISATHKNLKTLIQKGEFREDLYYRLNVMPVHLPPLRERKDDILLLAEHFLRRYAESGKGPLRGLSKKAQIKLQSLPWKGNVRELENVIERAIVLADGDLITENEILTEEMESARVTAEDLFNAGMTLKDIEREYIKYVLSRTGNRKEAATRILGIDRKTLYRKEKVYGIRQSTELM